MTPSRKVSGQTLLTSSTAYRGRRTTPPAGNLEEMRFARITIEADKMGGVPCIRGLRVPVATVVGMVAEGMTAEEILEAYPYLERGDIREALEYAAEAVRERSLPLRRGA